MALLLAVAVAGAGTVAVVAASSGSEEGDASAKRAKGFHPKSLKGKWTGDWVNTTFNSSGDVIANVKVKKKKFIPLVDFSGNVLGCPDPPADSVTLKKGNGKNKWNKDGFKVDIDSNAFGDDFKFKYDDDTGKVKASGSSPCNPNGPTFKFKGKLSSKKFSGDADISFGPGQPGAKSTVDAKKD